MKNKIFCGIAVLAIAAVAAFNVSLRSKSSNLSGVSLANVEALAQENNSPYQGTTATCTQTVVVEHYTASGGWTWDAGGNVWLFNGKVSKTGPSEYTKTTTTTVSSWSGCKPQGATACTAAPC